MSENRDWYDMQIDGSVEAERDRIIAWLRSCADLHDATGDHEMMICGYALRKAADAIRDGKAPGI